MAAPMTESFDVVSPTINPHIYHSRNGSKKYKTSTASPYKKFISPSASPE